MPLLCPYKLGKLLYFADIDKFFLFVFQEDGRDKETPMEEGGEGDKSGADEGEKEKEGEESTTEKGSVLTVCHDLYNVLISLRNLFPFSLGCSQFLGPSTKGQACVISLSVFHSLYNMTFSLKVSFILMSD